MEIVKHLFDDLQLWTLDDLHNEIETLPPSTFDLAEAYVRVSGIAKDRTLVLEGVRGLKQALEELVVEGMGDLPQEVEDWLEAMALEFKTKKRVEEGYGWPEMLELADGWTRGKVVGLAGEFRRGSAVKSGQQGNWRLISLESCGWDRGSKVDPEVGAIEGETRKRDGLVA